VHHSRWEDGWPVWLNELRQQPGDGLAASGQVDKAEAAASSPEPTKAGTEDDKSLHEVKELTQQIKVLQDTVNSFKKINQSELAEATQKQLDELKGKKQKLEEQDPTLMRKRHKSLADKMGNLQEKSTKSKIWLDWYKEQWDKQEELHKTLVADLEQVTKEWQEITKALLLAGEGDGPECMEVSGADQDKDKDKDKQPVQQTGGGGGQRPYKQRKTGDDDDV
jgi:hypothetical protein